jgi:hypothetical protein
MTVLTPAKAGGGSDTTAPKGASAPHPGAPSGKPLLTADGRRP